MRGTITEGEVVGIIIKPEANWWKIESKAGQGLVPATYLRELDLQEGKARFDGSKNEFGGHSARSRPQIASANLELDANKSSYQRAGASLMPLESAETGARHRTPSMQGAFLGMAGSAEQWSSNVDPSLVSQISNEEKKRQEAIFELIVTEGSYVRDLQLVVEIFYRRMQDLMQEHDLRAVFANIEDILLANSVLLSSLEDLQQKNSFFIDLFGNHFATFIPSLECYATYCGNQMAAQKFLKRRQEEDAKLDRFLKETFRSGKSRSLDLNSWLLKPMQRITRYSLLLKQILQHTPNNHPDFVGLQQALRLIERVATNVNNAAQEYENRLKVAEIMNLVDFETDEVNFRIDLTTQTRHLGPRICLLEGQLTKSKSGRKLHAYLLTDILLFVEPSSKQSGSKVSSAKGYQFVLYRKPIPLVDHVAVQDTGEDSFAVVHGQDTVQVRAPNFSEKRRWISSINEQVEICMIAERSHRDQHSAMESNRARLAGVDAMGTLVINVIEARGLPPGANGKRDVYCAVELSGQILKTKALEGSNPRWNQSLSFTVVKSATTFRLATYNVDMFSPDGIYVNGIKMIRLLTGVLRTSWIY
ncbi:Dbl homology domain-containing protein [Cladochytrium replicatum]|nr:Dbl homology domain-containing protein [Cladochytrium replicatum]